MKKIFIVCVVVLSVVLALPAAAQLPANSPAFYIDSQLVNFASVYLDPDNIDHISVVKGTDYVLHSNGRLYLTLKQPFTSFLTLADIVRRQTDISEKKILFIINDKVIRDTTGVRIDPGLIGEVHGVSTAEIPYVGEKMGVIVIRTRSHAEAQKEKETIRIRG
jgi:hypothetical protein